MIACKIGNVTMIKEILKYNPDILLKNEVRIFIFWSFMFLTSSSQNGDDAWELTCEFTADKTNQPIIRSLMDVSYLSLFVYLFTSCIW